MEQTRIPTPATAPRPRSDHSQLTVRKLGRADYTPTLQAMQQLTTERNDDTPDEIWLLEHPPVYTLGLAGKDEHLPRIDNGIPVVRIDRGGQITYHGPGQPIVYTLLDLTRRGLKVRSLVQMLEQAGVQVITVTPEAVPKETSHN